MPVSACVQNLETHPTNLLSKGRSGLHSVRLQRCGARAPQQPGDTPDQQIVRTDARHLPLSSSAL